MKKRWHDDVTFMMSPAAHREWLQQPEQQKALKERAARVAKAEREKPPPEKLEELKRELRSLVEMSPLETVFYVPEWEKKIKIPFWEIESVFVDAMHIDKTLALVYRWKGALSKKWQPFKGSVYFELVEFGYQRILSPDEKRMPKEMAPRKAKKPPRPKLSPAPREPRTFRRQPSKATPNA